MIDKGVFVELDYTGRTGGKVFDTTVKEVGDKEGLGRENYKPMLVQVGGGEVIRGVDEELQKMSEGEKKTIKVSPEKGYGLRNPELVKLVPLKAFKKNDINPVPGMVLNLDNMPARVQSVSGGRVRIDFNHELAGKELEFDLSVAKVIKTDEGAIKALAERLLPEAKVTVKENECIVTITETKKDYLQRKAVFVRTVLDKIEKVKKVKFEETFEKPVIKIDEPSE